MNRSIRYKLVAYMTVSIIVFAFLLFGANTFFAEKYYVMHKKNILIKTSKESAQLIFGLNIPEDFQKEELIYSLNRLERGHGVSIVIGMQDGTVFYPASHYVKGMPKKGYNANPFAQLKESAIVLDKKLYNVKSFEPYDANSYFVVTKDPDLNFDTLRYQTRLENGLTLLVWAPMAEVSESAAVSNRFTAIVALLTLALTGLWIFYISDHFTKPIKDINTITKQMAVLDFSKTLEVNSEDEIGQLSVSINHLSGRLCSAISELNTKNKQLERDIDKSKKIDALRKEFVSNVSHELKTPIFLIQGYAEGLRANVAADEEKRAFYCDVIMEEAEKMDILVKDLLNLSQLESGNMELHKSSFDVSRLIQDTIKKLEPMLEEQNIRVQMEIEAEQPAYGDVVRIEQALVNYLNNAINHVDEHRCIKVAAVVYQDKIRVSVFNTGQHIPEELFDKLWTSFYKVDQARTRSYGGTGLGLAIVKAIQQAHNNLYGVRNSEDGVQFWFDIDKIE